MVTSKACLWVSLLADIQAAAAEGVSRYLGVPGVEYDSR